MRLIDADTQVTVQTFDVEHEEYDHITMSVSEALDFMTDQGCPPAIDAAPVVHGRWILAHNGTGICSVCNRMDHIDRLATHCRYCGAKMDGGKNDATD